MPKKGAPLILPASSSLDETRSVFKRGGIIAYPTETFYGLGVDPFNEDAIESLFTLKGRSFKSPISVIIAETGMLKDVSGEVPPAAVELIKRFWPGPLTIIFKAGPLVPPSLISNTGKIGVRVPGSPVAQRLSRVLSSPITATSANPSGKKPPNTAGEVIEYFNGSIDLIIDGGRLPGKLGSTIVDVTGEEVKIIREGEVPAEEVLKTLE